MTRSLLANWVFWAVLSAAFAALTAIFAKVGVAGVDSDFATLIRTVVILALVAAIAGMRGAWQPVAEVPGRTWLFLLLSGLATAESFSPRKITPNTATSTTLSLSTGATRAASPIFSARK